MSFPWRQESFEEKQIFAKDMTLLVKTINFQSSQHKGYLCKDDEFFLKWK